MATPDVSPENTPLENPVEPQPGKQIPNWVKIAGGFAGWYIVNAAIWVVFVNTPVGIICNLFIFPLNVIVPIVLAIKRGTRQVGLGILAALGINFVLSWIVGAFTNATCFIPFFIKGF